MDLHGGRALAPLLTSAYAAPEVGGPRVEVRGAVVLPKGASETAGIVKNAECVPRGVRGGSPARKNGVFVWRFYPKSKRNPWRSAHRSNRLDEARSNERRRVSLDRGEGGGGGLSGLGSGGKGEGKGEGDGGDGGGQGEGSVLWAVAARARAMVVAARARAVAARATAAADWEMTVAAITMAGLARATVPVGLARAALARARVEQAMEAAASEQSLSVSQACSTVICGTSTTSRVDSAPAWLSSGFCARASRSQMDLLRRRHLPAPRSGRKK